MQHAPRTTPERDFFEEKRRKKPSTDMCVGRGNAELKIGGNIEVFIKAFLYANTEDESMKIITDILSPLNIEIGKTKIELEPYWKINGIYSIDVYVDLDVSILPKEMLEKFLKTIANKWISYGEPINEILISRNDIDIVIYNEKIEMINIHIEDEN